MELFATIPFFEQPQLDLGIAQIYAWGVLVASGFLLGTRYAAKWAVRSGQSGVVVYDYAMWVFVGGFLGAHVFHALFYDPEQTLQNPLYLFYVWEGFSSFGGFFGGAIATMIFFRRRAERFIDYADPLALGLVPGWAIGRIGCFLAKDHPGTESDFFLAVDNRLGVSHHDLGLYDSLLSWAIAAFLLFYVRKNPHKGVITGWMCGLYAVGRFFLDDLRIVDARYFGYTPAQYSCLVLLLFGVGLVLTSKKREPLLTTLENDGVEPEEAEVTIEEESNHDE